MNDRDCTVHQSKHHLPRARLALATCLIICSGAAGESPQSSPAAATGSECSRCHFCENPTAENRCLLHICTGTGARQSADRLEAQDIPDVIILDELENAYLPVPFDHLGHARMAQMAEGCAACHHYTPEGSRHPACKTCHEASTAGTDIYKPGLKGAYHQQCLNCHRDWIDETDCDVCHRAKARLLASHELTSPTRDDILGRMHPPIPEPDSDLYNGQNSEYTATKIIFRHKEHVHRFGLRCAECHHEPNCTRCHTQNSTGKPQRTLADHHRPCISCHKAQMDLAARESGGCERCHWQVNQLKPPPFNHAGTGWPLGPYHLRTGCRDCHTTTPFARLDSSCNICHTDWRPDTFDHRVTGQVLDETHIAHDCEECHLDRRFDREPTCSECHDEDEDEITYPEHRPGPLKSDA